MIFSPFKKAPEFVDEDNRLRRTFSPISLEQMHNKHEVLFPAEVVEGKRVLDLGCCLGATGHWCLSLGAKSYTGVEVQKEYAEIGQQLMQQYHPGKGEIVRMGIEEFLEHPPQQSYDVIAMLGVIYVFTDYYSVLKKISLLSTETIVIEGLCHNIVRLGADFCGVEFTDAQLINLADQDASLIGRGTRISPAGLRWLMEELGFISQEGLLYPKQITSIPDIYNPQHGRPPLRYLLRFMRSKTNAPALSRDLQGGRQGLKKLWKE